MKLEDLMERTCLIGLQYFDTDGSLLNQDQHAGTVINVDEKNGVSIRLAQHTTEQDQTTQQNKKIASDKDDKIFVLPPILTTWFKAPEGEYRDADKNLLIRNPDFLVTWEVHKTQKDKQGDHEWWEWVIPQSTPTVN